MQSPLAQAMGVPPFPLKGVAEFNDLYNQPHSLRPDKFDMPPGKEKEAAAFAELLALLT